MKSSAAHVVRDYLVQIGLGTLPSLEATWPIFVGKSQDKPDNMVLLSNTMGMMNGRDLRSGKTHEHFGLSMLVRSTEETIGYKRADLLCKVFDAIFRQVVTVDSVRYMIQSISRRTQIVPLGSAREEKELAEKRILHSANLLVAVTDSFASLRTPPVVTSPTAPSFWYTQIPAGAINGTNRVFTISEPPSTSITQMLFRSGVLQKPGSDYTISGNVITFVPGHQPVTNDTLQFVHIDEG